MSIYKVALLKSTLKSWNLYFAWIWIKFAFSYISKFYQQIIEIRHLMNFIKLF